MRTMAGMKFLQSEMTQLDKSRVKAVATPMPSAFSSEVVTPKVGHMPSIMTKTGFSRTMPRVRLERLLFFMTGCSRIKFLVC